MRYMMFIKHTEDYRNADVPASLYEEMGKFIEETTKSGNFVAGAGLQPLSAGARVRLKSGKITVIDGPLRKPRRLSAATRSSTRSRAKRRSRWRGASWSYT
jgi:hypothetical protein